VYALRARFRWCLTGTPIQNRIEDFGALINFLRVQPFDSHSMFTHHIANPVKNGDQSGFKKLKKLVHSTSLRRTKAFVFGTLDFPPRINQEITIELSEEERSIYAALKDNCIEVMDFMSCSEDRQKPVGNVFKLILRLRQVCNHTNLLPANVLKQVYNKDFVGAVSNGQEICNSCGSGIVITESKNTYEDFLAGAGVLCADCKSQDKDDSAGNTSPGTAFSNELGENDIMDVGINHGLSSKMEALLRNLHAYRSQSTACPIKR
jgi:SNF2 family DNA or RNA helicase